MPGDYRIKRRHFGFLARGPLLRAGLFGSVCDSPKGGRDEYSKSIAKTNPPLNLLPAPPNTPCAGNRMQELPVAVAMTLVPTVVIDRRS